MEFRASVLLSVQRALWDLVTPSLRGVAVRAEHPVIDARFLFENEPSDDDREDVSLAETSSTAEFSDDVTVSFRAVRVPASSPRTLVEGEEWVYLRKERGSDGAPGGGRRAAPTTRLAICGSRSGGAVASLVDGAVAPLARFLHEHPAQVYHGPVGTGIEVVTHLADHYHPPLLKETTALFGHDNVVRRAEYVLVIGGGAGTNEEVDLAFSLGKKVIPFAASGGAARRAAELLSLNGDYRRWLTAEDLDALVEVDGPDEFVGHVRRLVT